jgi:hypothetical protein
MIGALKPSAALCAEPGCAFRSDAAYAEAVKAERDREWARHMDKAARAIAAIAGVELRA